MSNTVIKLEDISKQYRLGTVGSKTMKEDFWRWWARLQGKEDPTLKIGTSNQLDKREGEYVWALKDINLEVKQGEILGIIGKNGAGKSTLLKILSRVTAPTTGVIKVKGRIASLLEVGTGFHPELTGRENVFLNGAILGMSKQEIRSKFDEIVDFSGIEKYIDTPVKRYSSGMYVRLAFAVAAHLEPEILVVDEVLAVGDAEFQKKALGKMDAISKGEGRTVLFVSHNMGSIKSLCSKGILLNQGCISTIGETDDVVRSYISGYKKEELIVNESKQTDGFVIFEKAFVKYEGTTISNGISFCIDIKYSFSKKKDFALILNVYRNKELSFASTSFYLQDKYMGSGIFYASFVIPKYLLNPGFHSFDFSIVDGTGNMTQYAYFKNILHFEVEEDYFRRGKKYNKGWDGAVSPILTISNKLLNE